MSSSDIFEAVESLSRSKGIDVDRVVNALEEAIAAAAKKNFHSEEDIVARFDRQTGQLQAYARFTVVEEVEEPDFEMDLEQASQLKPDAKPGDALFFPRPTVNLGRIAAQQAKQVIYQKVREAERENIYAEFKDRVGEMLTGTVKRFEKGDIIVDIGRTEALLPKREQSRVERHSIGDRVRAVVVEVQEIAKGPQVVLSRAAPELLVRLFEMEVPEIYDGTVTVLGCVREPGERAKVAVRSENRDIDPVGACVGIKGSRVQAIIRELRGEKIDIIPWAPDPLQLLMNALNPARVNRVIVQQEAVEATEEEPARKGAVEVHVDDDQLSLAIGKKGQNVRLAARLTGWIIEVRGERERKEAAEREMQVLAAAPEVLQQLPGIDDAKAQKLIEAGVRTWEEFLDTPPIQIMELLGLDDPAMDAMIEKADELEEVRLAEQAKRDAEEAARRAEEAARRAEEQAAAAAAEELAAAATDAADAGATEAGATEADAAEVDATDAGATEAGATETDAAEAGAAPAAIDEPPGEGPTGESTGESTGEPTAEPTGEPTAEPTGATGEQAVEATGPTGEAADPAPLAEAGAEPAIETAAASDAGPTPEAATQAPGQPIGDDEAGDETDAETATGEGGAAAAGAEEDAKRVAEDEKGTE